MAPEKENDNVMPVTQVALNKQAIEFVQDKIASIEKTLREIFAKLEELAKRPSWAVSIIITFLSVICTALIVYNTTKGIINNRSKNQPKYVQSAQIQSSQPVKSIGP